MKIITAVVSIITLLFLCGTPSASVAEGKHVVSEEAMEKAIKHQEMGSMYDDQGEIEKAIEEYRKSLSYNPEDPNTLFNLGYVYLKASQPAESVKLFTKLHEILPNDYEVCNLLGVSHSGAGNKLEAIQAWKESLKIEGNQPKVVEMIDEMKMACAKEGIKVED